MAHMLNIIEQLLSTALTIIRPVPHVIQCNTKCSVLQIFVVPELQKIPPSFHSLQHTADKGCWAQLG